MRRFVAGSGVVRLTVVDGTFGQRIGTQLSTSVGVASDHQDLAGLVPRESASPCKCRAADTCRFGP